ncbi:MAG: hypothetical protein KGJ09_10355, partial [Candidatus Omnitrophica bacterium]|nr:hypothetical protein [Candidatus Omnitrophota bacterium]
MELPLCDYRQPNAHETGKHVCTHPWTHGGTEMGVDDSFCHNCSFSKTITTLRPQPPTTPSNPGRGDCRHLGGITRKVDCPTCNPAKKIQVAVHSCAVFGECTINKPVPGLACCSGRCQKYQQREKWSYDGPVKRHLLYHVYPSNGQKNRGIWQANVRQLFDSGRFEQFSTAHVAVAVDGNTDSVEDVRQAFADSPIPVAIKEFPNDPGLREVVSHNWLWSQVPKGKNDLTFWGHTKGVTHSVAHKTVHQWARMMYDSMLDYPGIVEDQLRNLACTGAFKKLGAGWNLRESKSQWHYTGSF